MTSQLENVAHKLDQKWVEEELIPLLVAAYGEQENGQWAEMVQRAAEALHELPIYEDFDTTIERFRLLLVNKDILSRAEIDDFGTLRDQRDICIGVFVRHAIIHGNYKLHTLGTDPDPNQPRWPVTSENQDTYIFGGKLAMRRANHGARKNKDRRKPYWHQDRFWGKNKPRADLQSIVPLLESTTIPEHQNRPILPQDHAKDNRQVGKRPNQLKHGIATEPTRNPTNAVGKIPHWPQNHAQTEIQPAKELDRKSAEVDWLTDRPDLVCRGSVDGLPVQEHPPQVQRRRELPKRPRNHSSRPERRPHWKGKPKSTSYANTLNIRGQYHAPHPQQYGNRASYQYNNVRTSGYGVSLTSNQYDVLSSSQYGFDQPSTPSIPPESQALSYAGPEFNQPYRYSGPPAEAYTPHYQHRGNPPPVHMPSLKPAATHDLRVGASEFLPGANGHGF